MSGLGEVGHSTVYLDVLTRQTLTHPFGHSPFCPRVGERIIATYPDRWQGVVVEVEHRFESVYVDRILAAASTFMYVLLDKPGEGAK